MHELRVNTAFEQMIVSVLIVASACGVISFIANIFSAVVGGFAWIDFIAAEFADALLYAFVIFLAGFFAAGVVIAPLFVALERVPYRRTWPYIAAMFAYELILYFFFFKSFAGTGALPFQLVVFAPGIIGAAIFGYRMGPYWRMAMRRDDAAPQQFPQIH